MSLLARRSGFKDELHHPLEPAAMHLHQELNQFPGRNFHGAVRHLVEFGDQVAELLDFFLEFLFVRPRYSF